MLNKPANITGAHTACIASIVFFASGFPAAGILLETWGPISLIAARTVLAIGLLLPVWILLEGWSIVKNAPWIRGLLIGGSGVGVGAITLLIAQSMTDAVTAALVAAMMPIAAVALEVMFDGRRLSFSFLIGVLFILIGGVIAAGANITEASYGFGAALGVLSTFIFGWGSRKAVKGLPELTNFGRTALTLTGAMIVSMLALGIFKVMGWQGAHYAALDSRGWGMLLIFAWVGMAASQVLWLLGIAKAGVGIASFHMNTAPFYVMLLLLTMGGQWNWSQAIGAAIVIIGVIIAQHKSQWVPVAAK